MTAADRQRYRNARQETTSFGCRFFLFPGNLSYAGKFVICGEICHMRGNLSCAGKFVICGEICRVRGDLSCAGKFVVCGEICRVQGKFRPIAGKYVVRDEFVEC